jgi:hypothetical protein
MTTYTEYRKIYAKTNPYKEAQKRYKSTSEYKEKMRLWQKNWRKNNWGKYMLNSLKNYSAKRKNLPFNLTIEDTVLPEVCPVFKTPFVFGDVNYRPEFDRRIPSLGYVKGNVRIISGRANRLKNDATIEELQNIIDYMKNN